MTYFGRSQGRLTTVKVLGGTLRLNFGDATETIRFFEDKRSRLQDMEPVLDAYGRYLVEDHIASQFQRQGHPRAWAALSPRYAAWKEARYPGKPILELTGRMKRGFRHVVKPRSLRIVNQITAGQRGNRTPRWFWHQFGTPRMPARPMLQITDADLAVLTKYTFEYLETGKVTP